MLNTVRKKKKRFSKSTYLFRFPHTGSTISLWNMQIGHVSFFQLVSSQCHQQSSEINEKKKTHQTQKLGRQQWGSPKHLASQQLQQQDGLCTAGLACSPRCREAPRPLEHPPEGARLCQGLPGHCATSVKPGSSLRHCNLQDSLETCSSQSELWRQAQLLQGVPSSRAAAKDTQQPKPPHLGRAGRREKGEKGQQSPTKAAGACR